MAQELRNFPLNQLNHFVGFKVIKYCLRFSTQEAWNVEVQIKYSAENPVSNVKCACIVSVKRPFQTVAEILLALQIAVICDTVQYGRVRFTSRTDLQSHQQQ